MTIGEKRKELDAICESHGLCTNDCPVNEVFEKCPLVSNEDDETIEMVYSKVFPTESIIKDSGERRQFYDADGKPLAVRDMSSGKGRMDLLPWAAIMEVSKHCENGSKKYGEHNVDKGLNTSSFADSALRHTAKWLDGWTDEPHLLAAAWNLLWAIQMELKHPELCDVPWKDETDAKN